MCDREDVIAGVVELNKYEQIQLKFPPSIVTKEYSQTCNWKMYRCETKKK